MKKSAVFCLFCCLPLVGQNSERVRHVFSVSEPLTVASSRPPREIGHSYLRKFAGELSLSDADLAGVYVAKEYRTEHNGVTHVVYKQQFKGVDILNAEWVVNLDRDGRVLNAGGDLYAAPASLDLPPPASSRAAVRSAVRAVNPKLGQRYLALESERASTKSNRVRYASGVFPEDIEGELVWYALAGVLRPAWVFDILDEDGVNRYETVIEDATQTELAKLPMTFYQKSPRGLVFDRESPQPNPTPGVRLSVAPLLTERTMQSFQGDPVASPGGWLSGAETVGNNAVVGENLLGIRFLLTPNTSQSANGEFSFPLALGPGMPGPLNYRDAATVNLFYWMNRAHDLHYPKFVTVGPKSRLSGSESV